MTEPRLLPFHITGATPGIAAANGVAATWVDIWRLQIPQGTGLILQASDQVSMYLEDNTAAQCDLDGSCRVRIEVRDPAEQDVERIFGEANYLRVRPFQDRALIARLGVTKPVKVYERQWLVITAIDDATITIANCYFDILTSKVAAVI